MRSDLAALIPPLVIAAAFIVGVVALLRREMAPRRQVKMRPETRAPLGMRSAMNQRHIPHETRNGDGEDGSAENSANGDVVVSNGTDRSGRAHDRSLDPAHEDSPPTPPRG
ncbi:MAG: hypothetical protein ACM3ML_30900 [Micromonosporaceae bacterium]